MKVEATSWINQEVTKLTANVLYIINIDKHIVQYTKYEHMGSKHHYLNPLNIKFRKCWYQLPSSAIMQSSA